MALTIHAPHLPHLEDLARHRTMLIGIAAVAITAGTVYVVQQQINDSTATLSAPAAIGSVELRSGPRRAGAEAFGSAPAPAAAGAIAFRSGHLLAGTDPVEGAPTAAVASTPATFETNFPSGHLLP